MIAEGVAFSPRSRTRWWDEKSWLKQPTVALEVTPDCFACPILPLAWGDPNIAGQRIGRHGCHGSYRPWYYVRKERKKHCLVLQAAAGRRRRRKAADGGCGSWPARCPLGSGSGMLGETRTRTAACPRLLLFPFPAPFSPRWQAARSQAAFYAFFFLSFSTRINLLSVDCETALETKVLQILRVFYSHLHLPGCLFAAWSVPGLGTAG